MTLKYTYSRKHNTSNQLIEAVIAGWKSPKFEGRPCTAMDNFGEDPMSAYGALADAREAGLVETWIDEYDGLFRARLTEFGRKKMEKLNG